MKKRVYIETTIPSFYYENRKEHDMIARRDWTRYWWDIQKDYYELVTSVAVIEELDRSEFPSKKKALRLIDRLSLLPIVDELEEIVDVYLSNYVMPTDSKGDALHLALASYHHCHFLLTWNCSHLANANKFEHIRHINTTLGLFVPILTTPVELFNVEGEIKYEKE